ncbi:MocR-like pyridoxine biosynthesis transcription factor PdxR [Sphaerimonospora thailandensis]|uniref:GntR family transcriptional regulator n=1 Tax=Sphaerimonospora thailandensis TaxID=795644 RepID=A0A8J3R4S5_9ACTN|nr:PLP-dependent aminotransferase family protein [Sphaerimonospora thailandensis]GIH69206.1 GntR family transcriptional regulator [Sphaerimonospora thailandensis]
MTDLHLVIDRGRGGIAAQIAGELRDAIRSGRLVHGTRLPATRELARDLGVSRGVAVEAYERLVAEGFLEARVGAGTRVAAVPGSAPMPGKGSAAGVPPAKAPPPTVGRAETPRIRRDRHQLSYHGHRVTSPDLGAFPRRAWLAAIRHALTTLPNDAFDYGDPGGVPELREELAAYLRRVRACDAAPENVAVVTGVAQGLSVIIQVLSAERGRRIVLAVEDPTSPRQTPLLRRAGADLAPVPVDAEGILVEALAGTGAEAVLVTPAHQYPTGVVLSPRRRAELIAWAAETGALILEDDYDAEFRFDRDPVGCLQGLAPDRVVLAGSVSKPLAPGLRLGWIVAPPRLARAVRLARGEIDLGSPVIDQYALAHLIRTGGYDRHLRRMRREYRIRRDAMVLALAEHLPWIRVHGISAGLHVYAEFPESEGRGAGALTTAARAAGLTADVVETAASAERSARAFVVGFARLPAHRITSAVREFATLLG